MLSLILQLIMVLNSSGWADCARPDPHSRPLMKGDFKRVFKSHAEARARFDDVYRDSRRWPHRVHRSPETLQWVFEKNQRQWNVPDRLIHSIVAHVEQAHDQGLVDFLFYPDMGHAHILQKIEGAPDLQSALNSEASLLLYHTAELFEMRKNSFGPLLDDPWLQHRYQTRNLLGSVGDDTTLTVLPPVKTGYNTVRNINGYSHAGLVYLSANANGCFQYFDGQQLRRFDVAF